MDRGNRPVGREKKVGSGEGQVERRGEGFNNGLGGPVGNQDGYADRKQDNSSNNLGSSNNSSAGFGESLSGFGGGPSTRSGGSKGIIFFIIIAIVLYSLYSCYSKKNQANPNANNVQNSTSGSNFVLVDNGPYPVSTTVSNLARNKRTIMKGAGKDTVTIMVYMCGTDLESEGGMATKDIQEMLYAEFSDNVNVIVETGGAYRWQNKVISSQGNQRFLLKKDGLVLLEDNLGKRSMVNPSTLTDFIKYSKGKFPAYRYELILWDHGGGSLSGYGFDQFFPNDSMTVSEISTALKNSMCTFDMIGFDACLMGNLETAIAIEPYADYMIASEETEPDVGWDYTGWISALSKNPSIPTVDLAKILIDDYVKEVGSYSSEVQGTLSLIDLAELKGTIPSALQNFAKSTTKLIDEKKYQTVSDARTKAREFATSSRINQIDLVNFAQNIGTPEAISFSQAMKGCIKYNRSSGNISNAYGCSVFFPYDNLPMMSPMLDAYNAIGMDGEYSRCIKSFASITAGGQIASSGNNNLLQTLLNGFSNSSKPPTGNNSPIASIIQQLIKQFLAKGDFSSITGLLGNSLNWLNTSQIQEAIPFYQENTLDAKMLKISEKDGQQVLELSEKQWDLIQEMEMNVFIDDGKGFIDLGLDNVYEYNSDGDLIMEYDGTWLALNGQIVSYYVITEDRKGSAYSIQGRIPAMLNDQLVDIIVVFTDQNPSGNVLGAQKKYNPLKQTETIPKGLITIKPGDKIDYLCDYYTYDGKYNDTFYLGKEYTATGKWKIENLSVGKKKYQMTYKLIDIYNNHYWTPSISN